MLILNDFNESVLILNDLQKMYSQFTKYCQLELLITNPTASSIRSRSTLKHIKSFLINTMTNERQTYHLWRLKKIYWV